MKILHTSDWHLDCRLYDRRRSDEHQAFLNWLCQTVIDREIDILIVSGDVYDNRTPTLESQQMYNQFLVQLYQDRVSGKSVCRHVIITAGNHDSTAFLETSKQILQYFNITVVAKAPELVVVPPAGSGKPDDLPAIIAAIPFLSEMELRKVLDGEPVKKQSLRLMEGVKNVYQNFAQQAEEEKQKLLQNSPFVPIIAMGHLFAQGASCLGADGGERDIYVGTMKEFPAGEFPDAFDYIALGHLHVPQAVGGQERIQYSGSPIPVGFGEAKQTKRVVEVQWTADGKQTVTSIEIPCFQQLVQISEKEKSVIEQKTAQLISDCQQNEQNVWLEILYRGSEAPGLFCQKMEEMLANTQVSLLAFKWLGTPDAGISRQYKGETLRTLNPVDVFKRTLISLKVPEGEWEDLLDMYKKILEQVTNENTQTGI